MHELDSAVAEVSASLQFHRSKARNYFLGVLALAVVVFIAALVFGGYMIFNRSKAATAAREISKQHQEIRKEESKNPSAQTQPDTSTSPVTSDSIDKQTQQIDTTLRSNDLGSDQVQADDLSDKGLGLQ